MSETPTPGKSFEEALLELEQLVRDLEDGQIGLEQALSHYEKGVGLLRHCQSLLQKTDQRIQALTGVNEQGEPLTEPLDTAGTEEVKPRPASRRKKGEGKDQGSDSSLFGS